MPSWQSWVAGSDEAVAKLPHETKVEFGTIFGRLPPLAEILQKQGPVAVFESVNRLARENYIELQIKDYGRGRYKVRYRMADMGELVEI